MRFLRTGIKRILGYARDIPWQSYDENSFTSLSRIDLKYKIPLASIQTWETNVFGRTHRSALTRYRTTNLAFDHFFYDSARRDLYMETQWTSSSILDVYKSARHGVTRADIFRYCYIYKCGGFYTDIAKVPPSPLLGYLYSNPSLVLFSEASGYSQPYFFVNHEHLSRLGIENAISPFYNGFFAAAPEHKLFEYIIDYICSLAPCFSGQVFALPRQAILALTGPAAFNYGVQRYIENHGIDDMLVVPVRDPRSIKLSGANARYLQVKSYMDLSNDIVLS